MSPPLHWLPAARKKKHLHQRQHRWLLLHPHQLLLHLHLLQKPQLVPLLQPQLLLALPCKHRLLPKHLKMQLVPLLVPLLMLPKKLLTPLPLPLLQRSNFLNC